MKITKIVETPEGKFEFSCEFNSDQHKFIFETGLGYLVSIGAINLKAAIDEEMQSEQLELPLEKPVLN